MSAHNTFERPDEVKPKELTGVKALGGGLEINLSKMSVAVLEVGA